MNEIESALHDLGAPPRRARLHTRFRILRWTLVLAALLPGSCLYGLGRWEIAEMERLAREGQVAAGRISGMRISKARSTDYWLYAAFEVEGRSYEASELTSRERYERTAIGSPIDVTYLPSDPEICRVDRVDMDRVGREHAAFAAGAFAFFLAFGFVLWIYEHYVRRCLALLRRGETAVATIELPPPGRRWWQKGGACYAFRTADGVEQHGSSAFRGPIPEHLVPGAQAVVLYDAARPKRNALYPSLAALGRTVDAE